MANSQQVGGMMVSFRRSLWNKEKKNERNLSRKGEQDLGRKPRSYHHSGRKAEVTVAPKPQKDENPPSLIDHKKQGEELGYENEVLSSDSLASVIKSEIEEPSSCSIVKGEGNDDEIKDGNIHKASSVDEIIKESDLARDAEDVDYEREDKENAVYDLPDISKSCEGIDSQDFQSDVVNERKRHVSTSFVDSNDERRNPASTSKHNVACLLRNNLDTHIGGKRISNSHREIITTTAGTITDQVRSISAGDVRLPCSSPKLQRKNIPPPLKLPVDHVKRTLMWQASVDDLCGSPLLSRKRIFHIRRAMDAPTSSCPAERARTSSETRSKKWSVGSSGSNKLGVAAFISNVKKSLTDLFNIDGEAEDNHVDIVEKGDKKETKDDNCYEED